MVSIWLSVLCLVAVYGGLIWVVNPAHPERLERLREKYFRAD